jgi:hypothetical protein
MHNGRWVLLQHVQHQIYFCNIQIKHLQHTFEKQLEHCTIRLKHERNTCTSIAKYIQYPDETLKTYVREKHMYNHCKIYTTSWWNSWNIRMKQLKTPKNACNHAYICNIQIYFCSIQRNTCNILMKQSEHTLETYVYSHCNMCNILIYIYNTDIKHLKHTSETSETLETYVCNTRFQRNISLLFGNGGSSARGVHRCIARRWRGAHRPGG